MGHQEYVALEAITGTFRGPCSLFSYASLSFVTAGSALKKFDTAQRSKCGYTGARIFFPL